MYKNMNIPRKKLILITSKAKEIQKSKITLEMGKWVGTGLIQSSFLGKSSQNSPIGDYYYRYLGVIYHVYFFVRN